MAPNKHHIPQRTCVGCRQTMPKRELARLVRSLDGNVKLDHKGKESGRGAYLCKTKECWELALKQDRKDRLSHVLKTRITPENRAMLSEYGRTLPPAEVLAKGTG